MACWSARRCRRWHKVLGLPLRRPRHRLRTMAVVVPRLPVRVATAGIKSTAMRPSKCRHCDKDRRDPISFFHFVSSLISRGCITHARQLDERIASICWDKSG